VTSSWFFLSTRKPLTVYRPVFYSHCGRRQNDLSSLISNSLMGSRGAMRYTELIHTYTQYQPAVFHQFELWKETCKGSNPDRAMDDMLSVSHKTGTVVSILIFHLRNKKQTNTVTKPRV